MLSAGLVGSLLMTVIGLPKAYAQNIQDFPPVIGDKSEIPLYGEKPRTGAEKLADETFVDSVVCTGLSRKQGALKMINYGWDCIRLKQPKLAVGRFNQAWLLDPDNYHIYWGLASATAMLRDYDAAIQWFSEAKEMAPHPEPKMLCDFARVYTYKSLTGPKRDHNACLDRAIELFSQAALADPKLEKTYSSWAIALDSKRDYRGALEMMLKAKNLGGTTIDKRFVEHLQYEITESDRRKNTSISAISAYCEKFQSLLAKRCVSEPALDKLASVDFCVDKSGAIIEVKSSQNSLGSEEGKKVAKQIVIDLKKVKSPPTEATYPLWFSATLCKRPEDMSVCIRDINWKPYVSEVQYWIKQNWSPPIDSISRLTTITFQILSDGSVRNVAISKSSGDDSVDQDGLKTVRKAAPFLPLPEGVSDHVSMEFTFNYNVINTPNPNTTNLLFSEFATPKPIKVLKTDEELNKGLMAMESALSMLVYHSTGAPTHEPSKPLDGVNTVADLNQWLTYYYIYPLPQF